MASDGVYNIKKKIRNIYICGFSVSRIVLIVTGIYHGISSEAIFPSSMLYNGLKNAVCNVREKIL